MRPRTLVFTLLSATAVSALAGSGVACAAEQGGQTVTASVIEEVVVTARRREERLIDVPVAVTSLSRSRIEQFGVTDLESISTLAPNVNVSSAASGTGGSISIRGVGSPAGDAGIAQSVIVMVDGVPVDHGQIVNMAFFDLAHVEVLRGPETLFFGKNSPAGVLVLGSVDALGDWSGYARVGYEVRAERSYFEGAMSFPLTDTLSGRFALQASTGEGFVTNVARPLAVPPGSALPYPVGTILPGAPARHETNKNIAGRLTLKWEPTDRFGATLRLLVSDQERRDTLTGVTKCVTGISPQPHIAVNRFADPFSTCNLDWETSEGTIPTIQANGYPQSNHGRPFSTVQSQLGSLALDYDLGWMDISSVTGVYHYANKNWNQFASDITAYYAGVNNEHNTTYTEEIHGNTKLDGPLNFTGGIYFEHGDRVFYIVPQLTPIFPPAPNGATYTAIAHMPTKNDVVSPFIEAQWQITPQLNLAGGVRYTWEKRTGKIGYDYTNPNSILVRLGVLLPAGTFIHTKLEADSFDPQVTLTWRPYDGLMVYGAYKTGFKSGGITNPTVITRAYNASNSTFAPEHVEGFEAGVRWELRERTLTGSVTAFRYDFDDLQVSSFNQTTVSYVIQNAAKSRTQGIEADLTWQATDELSFFANLAYVDAQYAEFPRSQCYTGQPRAPNPPPRGFCGATQPVQDLSGYQLPKSSKYSAIFNVIYNRPLGRGLRLSLSGELNYRSKYNTSTYYQPWLVQDGYALVNASAKLVNEDQRWELAVIAKNLFNELYVRSAQDIVSGQIGNHGFNLGDPRTVAMQATYHW